MKGFLFSVVMVQLKLKLMLVAVVLLGALTVRADCPYPKAPPLPDFATASEEQMVAAMAALKLYDAEVNAYGQCLEQETEAKIKEAAMSASQIRQLKMLQAKKHNAAVAELKDKVKLFNDHVRALKSKSA